MMRSVHRDRAALSGALAGPTFAAGIAIAMAGSEEPFPRPGADADAIGRFFGQRPNPLRIIVAGQLVSAAALGRFAVSVAGLARRSGRGSGAQRAMALGGGALAAGSLGVAAAQGVALARDPSSDRAVARHHRMFLAGGPVHGAGFGMLLGALGVAGSRTGELPRPVARAAIIATAPNLAATLSAVVPPAAWLLPLARFPGLAVCAMAGTRLARG